MRGVEVRGFGVYRFRGAGSKKWVWQSLLFSIVGREMIVSGADRVNGNENDTLPIFEIVLSSGVVCP